MEQLVIKIERQINAKVFWQEYILAFQASKSVFWWLNKIRAELEPSLAFECSCNSGLCGACALRVDDRAVLACKEQVRCPGTLTIRPLAGLPIVKDLVIDWRRVDTKLRERATWLFTDYRPVSGEYALDVPTTAVDKRLAACISCGSCASVCPVLGKGGFEYPWVFCKGHRLVLDPSVPAELQQQVVADLSSKATYCIDCAACERYCPKGVQPNHSVADFVR